MRRGQSATGACTDNAGNSASDTQNGINIDKTAPTSSAAATTPPNGNSWYNSNVTVAFTCTDNLSGVTSCPVDETLSSEGTAGASTAQTITDLAGNSSLQYDAATDTYTYVWKTAKVWGGSCRQLTVKLVDGSEHTALFQFNGKVRSAEASEAEGDTEAAQQQLFLPLVNR